MSVYHHDREPHRNRVWSSPRRTPRRRSRERPTTCHRPRLELLESRIVLSPTIFTVDSTGSGTSGSGTSGTLPYVIGLANANTNTDGSEIEFDPSVFTSSSPQTIALGATLVLSETTGPEVIDGPGAELATVSGGGTVTVFQIDSGVTATITGLTVSEGSSTGDGGGIDNSGTLTISDSSVANNQVTGFSGNGGGIYNGGTLTISDSSVTNNQAAESYFYYGGGGIYNNGTLTISDSSVSDNSDTAGGGGIFNNGVVTINQSQITANASNGSGGGLFQAYNAGLAVITNSTFSSNAGGAIDNNSNMSIVNCTIADNAGGGINTLAGGEENSELLTIEDCTIVNNGGANLNNWDDAYPVTDVVVGNSIFSSIDGDIDSQGYNIFADSSNGLGFAPTDLLNVNPLLGPLQNNGGPTLTELPLAGSPAIDAGDNALIPAAVYTDQRGAGYPRIVNYTADIGAVEVQGPWYFAVTAEPPSSVTAGSALRADRERARQLGKRG